MRVIFRCIRPCHLGFSVLLWFPVGLTFKISYEHSSFSFLLKLWSFFFLFPLFWGHVLSPTYVCVWNFMELQLLGVCWKHICWEKHFLSHPVFCPSLHLGKGTLNAKLCLGYMCIQKMKAASYSEQHFENMSLILWYYSHQKVELSSPSLEWGLWSVTHYTNE